MQATGTLRILGLISEAKSTKGIDYVQKLSFIHPN